MELGGVPAGSSESERTTGAGEALRIRPGGRVAYRRLAPGSGGVLLHLDTGQYHSLNEVGALIWRLIGDETTFDVLLEDLAGSIEGEVSHRRLAGDLKDFVSDLTERDLLVMEQRGTEDPD